MRLRRLLLLAGGLALLAAPLALFVRNAWPLTLLVRPEAPPGQAAYLMMRPAGHMAFVLVFLQIVLGLQGGALACWAGLPSLLPLHKGLGLATLGMALLHPLLFWWAQVLRLGGPAFRETFSLRFGASYASFVLAIGALALYGLILAVLAALVGPRFGPRAWRAVHALAYPAFGLGWYHSLCAGPEVRRQPLQVLYTGMAVLVAGLLARRVWGVLHGGGS